MPRRKPSSAFRHSTFHSKPCLTFQNFLPYVNTPPRRLSYKTIETFSLQQLTRGMCNATHARTPTHIPQHAPQRSLENTCVVANVFATQPTSARFCPSAPRPLENTCVVANVFSTQPTPARPLHHSRSPPLENTRVVASVFSTQPTPARPPTYPSTLRSAHLRTRA